MTIWAETVWEGSVWLWGRHAMSEAFSASSSDEWDSVATEVVVVESWFSSLFEGLASASGAGNCWAMVDVSGFCMA